MRLLTASLLREVFFGCASGEKSCSAKTAHRLLAELPQSHNTQPKKNVKKALMILPYLSGPCAPAASFSSTMRTLPTKLAGNLTHTLINTPHSHQSNLWDFDYFSYIHYIPTPQQLYFCVHHRCRILLMSPKPWRLRLQNLRTTSLTPLLTLPLKQFVRFWLFLYIHHIPTPWHIYFFFLSLLYHLH